MARPRMERYAIPDRHDILILFAPSLPEVEVDVAVRDADDIPIIAAAVAGRADAIVTGDRGLLERAIQLLAVTELLEILDAN